MSASSGRGYASVVSLVRAVALPALNIVRSRASLVDGLAAALLAMAALVVYLSHRSDARLAVPALVCALAAVTTVAWRNRAPVAAVVVAGTGTALGAQLVGAHPLGTLGLVAGVASG
jgi:hypothetical protein